MGDNGRATQGAAACSMLWLVRCMIQVHAVVLGLGISKRNPSAECSGLQ